MSDTCKDCFNGCLERVPDNCVKYTGIDIAILEIEKGNSLAYIESQIFKYILSFITGKGIKINLSSIQLCSVISSNLPITGDIDLEHVITALLKGVCLVNDKITTITNQLVQLESDYNVGCLTGVTNASNTHETLQASINKICTLQTSFTALLNDLSTNYITSSNINNYIGNYNQTIGSSLLVSSKMIPYVAVPYFPTPATISGKFDASGAGLLTFAKVYMCNGNNGTPDLRGRTLVGATTGMSGGTLAPEVLPSVNDFPNPNYVLGVGNNGKFGQNSVQLTEAQMPIHAHTNTATTNILPNPHTHVVPNLLETPGQGGVSTGGGYAGSNSYIFERKAKLADSSFLTAATAVVISSTGNGQSHSNIQPSIGTYFIMYIP